MTTEMEEQDTTWGRVVESDEIYSPKTGRWYPVDQVVLMPNGQVKVKARGIPKYLPAKDADAPVKVRRGPTGKVVDIFQIIFSGATVPESVGITNKVGPTLDDLEAAKDKGDDDE